MRLREAQFFQVPEPGHLRRTCCGSGVFVCRVRPVCNRSARQPSVQGRDTVGGKLDLLLMLDFGDASRAELACQRALDCLAQTPANQVWRKFQRLAGWQPASHDDVDVGMVRVAVDHAAPFDRRSSVLLDPGNHVGCGSLEVNVCIFGREDDLEDALIPGLLPALCQPSERVLLRQSKAVGIGNLAADFGGRFPLRRQAVALGALPLDVRSMRLPSPWCPGGGIADVHDGSGAGKPTTLRRRATG